MSDGSYQILYPSELSKDQCLAHEVKLLAWATPNDAELGSKIRKLINNIEIIEQIEKKNETET